MGKITVAKRKNKTLVGSIVDCLSIFLFMENLLIQINMIFERL